MAYHRINRYTSIGRPLDREKVAGKALLFLMPLGAVLGAALAWRQGAQPVQVLYQAVYLLLSVYGSWALARELDPDDPVVAFLSLAAGLIAALAAAPSALLVLLTALGLVRIVNRSSGLVARKTDSLVLMALSVLVIYQTDSPLFGVVAALAFILDGSLREPLRRQWAFALVCLGGTVVYTVDHGAVLWQVSAPDTLFGWMTWLFLLIFTLNMLLLKSVRSKDDSLGKEMNLGRVKGGMSIGILTAVQGMSQPENVVLVVAVIAGICFGMAFRKGFKVPATT
jgi:hypothetical protein